MRSVLAGLLLTVGCSEQIEVALFDYQACRQQMTLEFIKQGTHPVAANMKAKAYCEEQQQQ
ncbi:MAG: hypothetical protein KZQ95_18030 [Candidatus Thiodiazotropha sp. (ex Epidulcina cf. delphinae)]|nr:hypothetical protein [Candidatus Thiodiazotropha sp. (ex Epidulcina cf. delphinae)]